MLGISRTRLVLYAVVVVALIAANIWRLDHSRPFTPVTAPASAPLLVLPDLTLTRPTATTAPARDLFRKPGTKAEAPPPAPPPPPRQIQPVDELAQQIDLANEILDGYRVVGILRVGRDMVATMERNGLIVTVKEGEKLPEGFIATEVAISHVILEHDALGVERRFQQGVLDGD